MQRHRACDITDHRPPPSDRPRRSWGWVRAGALASAVVVSTSLLAGCGSSSTATAAPSTCQQVNAALANGPDPDADPVGYAEAQVLPLRQIPASGHLEEALADLSAAYHRFVDTNGSAAAKKLVTKAGNAVNAVCPGAVS